MRIDGQTHMQPIKLPGMDELRGARRAQGRGAVSGPRLSRPEGARSRGTAKTFHENCVKHSHSGSSQSKGISSFFKGVGEVFKFAAAVVIGAALGAAAGAIGGSAAIGIGAIPGAIAGAIVGAVIGGFAYFKPEILSGGLFMW